MQVSVVGNGEHEHSGSGDYLGWAVVLSAIVHIGLLMVMSVATWFETTTDREVERDRVMMTLLRAADTEEKARGDERAADAASGHDQGKMPGQQTRPKSQKYLQDDDRRRFSHFLWAVEDEPSLLRLANFRVAARSGVVGLFQLQEASSLDGYYVQHGWGSFWPESPRLGWVGLGKGAAADLFAEFDQDPRKYGSSGRPGDRVHSPRPPSVHLGEPVISGRLAHDAVRRAATQNLGRLRVCYENAFAGYPRMEKRVQVRLVIDHTGAVTSARDVGGYFYDISFARCVLGSFAGLDFPVPEVGLATVVFPILFSSGF